MQCEPFAVGPMLSAPKSTAPERRVSSVRGANFMNSLSKALCWDIARIPYKYGMGTDFIDICTVSFYTTCRTKEQI